MNRRPLSSARLNRPRSLSCVQPGRRTAYTTQQDEARNVALCKAASAAAVALIASLGVAGLCICNAPSYAILGACAVSLGFQLVGFCRLGQAWGLS